MTVLFALIPLRVKLWGALIIVALLVLLRYRNKYAAEAVAELLRRVEDADAKRAAGIRARVRDRVRSDNDGYRD